MRPTDPTTRATSTTGSREAGSDRSWDPAAVRRWHGPSPHEGHRLLLAACLDDSAGTAAAAWRRWRSWCDFEHEDPGSYELASLAVARLGDAAGDGSQVARCRGWRRRSGVLTKLALDAVRRAAAVLAGAGKEAVAVGDLAGHGKTGLSVRTVELLAVGVPEAVLRSARSAAVSGPAGPVIESGRLPLAIGPNAAWHGRWVETAGATSRRLVATCMSDRVEDEGAVCLPTAEECLAMLLARGWRRDPPGGPRWIVAAHRLLARHPDLDPAGLAAAAARDGTVGMQRAAVGELVGTPGFRSRPMASRLAAIEVALRGAPNPLRARWRSAKAVRPASWWPARLVGAMRNPLRRSAR